MHQEIKKSGKQNQFPVSRLQKLGQYLWLFSKDHIVLVPAVENSFFPDYRRYQVDDETFFPKITVLNNRHNREETLEEVVSDVTLNDDES